MDTLYTVWDNITHYKTKSVHFLGLMNSASKTYIGTSWRPKYVVDEYMDPSGHQSGPGFSNFSLRLASIPILKALNPKPEALLDSPLPVCGTLLYQTYKPLRLSSIHPEPWTQSARGFSTSSLRVSSIPMWKDGPGSRQGYQRVHMGVSENRGP